MKKITSILTTLVLFCITVFAQAPQAFNYQGVARDAEGNPLVNREIGLQISILEDATTIYTETHSVLTSNLGLFAVQVGAGIPVFGTFESISWGDNPHFIEVSMDENGGTDYQLLGSSELLSVPYALYAENGSPWSKDLTGIHFNEGNVGLNTLNPDAKLTIMGNNNSDRSLVVKNEGDWSAHTYISGISASSAPGTAVIYEGNRSRGTLHEPLVVEEGDRVLALIGLPFIDGQYRPNASISFFVGNSVNSTSFPSFIAFKTTGTNEVSRSERMRISEEGNVGIGTTSPKAKLQVADGDVFIQDINHGIIMKSADGQCWRVTIDNTGGLITTPVACPD